MENIEIILQSINKSLTGIVVALVIFFIVGFIAFYIFLNVVFDKPDIRADIDKKSLYYYNDNFCIHEIQDNIDTLNKDISKLKRDISKLKK